ncbi:uncharacterized protein LOC121385202 [Gigantopelta aegis]|uniref:uncharacterized protein LOC121385202 n=1 Tax=Gigantopelta aegis TaxID=1735272 RepID=UPI001B888320|nr:uncharacterized protein LOC121385202 [Gigantopelta aegis]
MATSDISFQSQHTINGNDAYKCHTECPDTTDLIGLEGWTCYCLENTNESKIRQDRDVSKCSGNVEEICGGRGKVSIHRLTFPKPEILTLKADSLGLCAYMSLIQYGLQVKTGSNCSIPRGVAYSGKYMCTINWRNAHTAPIPPTPRGLQGP